MNMDIWVATKQLDSLLKRRPVAIATRRSPRIPFCQDPSTHFQPFENDKQIS